MEPRSREISEIVQGGQYAGRNYAGMTLCREDNIQGDTMQG